MNRQRKNKIWLSLKNIIAADVSSAVFLDSFLHTNAITREYASSLEIADIQKYKMIRKAAKVRVALRERIHIPFVFVIGKN